MSAESDLIDLIASTRDDPLKFVMIAFDWGHGDLSGESGPDEWQAKVLCDVRDSLHTAPEKSIRFAIASGHGVGKSALVAWIILWLMSTRPQVAGVVTANTATQLESKTWRELSVWHKRLINKNWFDWSATKICAKESPGTWFIPAIPWSKERSEAFAGLHAKDVVIIFDEASAIDNVIWEVAEGAMTTAGAMWFAFGNPTRNSGYFRECFGKFAHRWRTMHVDSRNAKQASKEQIEQWIDDYGEDSDFVRVRVRGVFPRTASSQFIGNDAYSACVKYRAAGYETMPKILGVDVARFGDDQTVITLRQGRKVHYQKKMRGIDTMQVAALVMREHESAGADAVFIDGVGIGAGVVDRLRQLGLSVIDVNAGSSAEDKTKYYNKRAEMWDRMRQAIDSGIELPDDPELEDALCGIEYGLTATQQLMLEKKADMKKRGLQSPDCGDSLALTYAENVLMRKKARPLGGQYSGASAWMG